MKVDVIQTASLGNRGYLVHDGKTAIAIDVQRDYGRWLQAAADAAVTIGHVLETHMHNDYVTGGFRLAEKLGATYVIPADSHQSFAAQIAKDGDEFTVGSLKIKAIHTPGHTPHHLSYAITANDKTAVFTGGNVLYGTVGRPDLISEEMTKPLAEAQYDSAQRLINELPATAEVYPTHGFGSFCSSAPGSGAQSSTLADEKKTNIAYTSKDKAGFIDTILGGLGAYPRYYAHMGKLNQEGPGDMTIKPIEKLDADKLKAMLMHDEWLIDIRNRKLYAAQHPAGAVGFELADSFSSYVGWIIPWGDAITLVGDSPDDLKAAQTQLGRIGMDQFVSQASDDIETYLHAGQKRSYGVTSFQGLAELKDRSTVTVLDVRTPQEWADGHINGAIHHPLYELLNHMGEIPVDKPLWVHCGSGYRASIAASLLDRHGRDTVLIDDDFSHAEKLGLTKV